MTPDRYPLGRIPSPPDPRDANFPMSLSLPTAVPATSKHWTGGPEVFNQGQLGACVAFAGIGFLTCSPTRHRKGEIVNQTGFDDYWACKAIDGLPPGTEGTYDRALMQVLSGQGRIKRYLWAENPDQMKAWVLLNGPVLVGTNWHERFFDPEPDRRGDLYLIPDGNVVGGHEYLIRGYSRPRDAYRMRNSWGQLWGLNGEAWVKADVLHGLVFQDGGDCVTAEEKLP